MANFSTPCRASAWRRARHGLALLALGLACSPAPAVFTYFPLANPRFIQLQVGAAGGRVNTVSFHVDQSNISPFVSPAQGVPDATTPATSPGGGVRVRMRGQWRRGQETLRLSVNSAAGMACVAGSGCGSTVIPFSTIAWTAYEAQTTGTYAGQDIQSGSFSGSASQTLASVTCCSSANTVEMANTLVFRYTNTTLYPAGRYRGTVVFTATIL